MQKIKQTVTVFIFMMLFTVCAGFFNTANAAQIKVEAGEGLSHVAKKAGCTDFLNASRWQSIALANRNTNWETFNAQLQPGMSVEVNCLSNATAVVLRPVVQQAAYVAPVSYNRATIEQKIRNKFGVYANAALRVAQCESGLNPSAIGDRSLTPSSYGVFQIRAFPERGTPAQLLNADYNIDYAFRMSGGGVNWGPWTCKP
jgi:hypothetical protein